MDWILFIRLVIFVTFLLLLVEGVVAVIYARRFYALYIRRHHEIELEIENTKRRLRVLEEVVH